MNWEYIAGFFDGEGHVALTRQKRCGENQFSSGAFRLTITQTQDRGLNLLKEIHAFLGERGIAGVIIEDSSKGRISRCYRLRLGGRNALRFMQQILPLVHIKKVECQDILRFRKIFSSLQGKGHRPSVEASRKGWEMRRRRYGPNGRNNKSIHASGQ